MDPPIVTLTTDFGQADGYVGTMKGVILSICPQATLVDVSHEIRPQAVRQAAYVLHTAAPYFPRGTIHVVVVDPGVGSARRPVAVQTERAIFVAPDNGVLSMALSQDSAHLAVHLTKRRYRLPFVSTTFHGRDVFAPAAAHLAGGTEPRQMGEMIAVTDLVTFPLWQPEPQADGSWQGEILHADRFGNLVTNFRFPMIPNETPVPTPEFRVLVGGKQITKLSQTFADVALGELVAYIGSDGYLEIAIREKSAAAELDVDVGTPVSVKGLARSYPSSPPDVLS